MNRAYALLNVKSFRQTGDIVTVEGVASTPTTDRMGDVVEPMGAKFKTPMPFMLHHDSRLPVGNVTFAQPTAKGIPFRAELPIVKEAGVVQDRVNEAIHLLQYKLIAAVSIGFAPIAGADVPPEKLDRSELEVRSLPSAPRGARRSDEEVQVHRRADRVCAALG